MIQRIYNMILTDNSGPASSSHLLSLRIGISGHGRIGERLDVDGARLRFVRGFASCEYRVTGSTKQTYSIIVVVTWTDEHLADRTT